MATKKKRNTSKNSFIPVCEPVVGRREQAYVREALKTNWISSKGRFVEEFAQNFARFCGAQYCVLTTSGTTALHLALSALGIGPGDEVIIPAFTMIATAFAVSYTGATPVLVDSEPATGNIDVSQIEEKITPRTKAIIPVHIYGHPCEMDSLMKLARKYKLLVVEDAAEAHGAEYKGQRCGGIGHMGCFSFYANKIITMGEGGAVVTNNKKIAERLKLLADLAHSPKKRFSHIALGFNYRLTNLQAAVGMAQLERVDDFIAARRRNAHLYNEMLTGIPGLRLLVEKEGAKNVYWMYGVVVEKGFGMSRDELMAALAKKKIGTRAFFIPMHQQPVYRKMGLFKDEKYPVAEELGRRGLYLPSGSGLSEADLERVGSAIKRLWRGRSL
jgi:perosamine synthetase